MGYDRASVKRLLTGVVRLHTAPHNGHITKRFMCWSEKPEIQDRYLVCPHSFNYLVIKDNTMLIIYN